VKGKKPQRQTACVCTRWRLLGISIRFYVRRRTSRR
jgi:hypothetical protein